MITPPGLRRLRLDGGLVGFNDVLELLLSSGERVPASGKKVVAKWAFLPVEPIFAAGALPYDPHIGEGLRHVVFEEDTSFINRAVESGLPSDFCPWNLAMAGSLTSGKSLVPIDLVTVACGCWCDSMSKSWHFTSQKLGRPFHYFDIPRFDAEIEESAIDYLVEELKSLFGWLEDNLGKEVTDVALSDEIRSTNRLRQAMSDLTDLLQADEVPIPALEYYLLQMTMSDCLQAPDALYHALQKLTQESKDRLRVGTPTATMRNPLLRVYYSGVETQELSVFNMIEDSGGALVGCDTYLPLFRGLVPESGSPVKSLAEWIWRTPYSFPTPDRIRATIPHMKKQKAECVIINNNTGCRYFTETSKLAKDLIREELGLPVLTIETALPGENVELTESRIKAFIGTYS
jgi:benzoyl-CoA reductase/2-hydroxyglutaryl-CoA dehydratase subunit BcrC/BadD/HgdB